MRTLLFALLLFPACLRAQTITTVVGTGVAGFSGDGGPAVSALLEQPVAIAFDKYGNMYVVDGRNYRVRKINTAGIITTIAGTGTMGYSGDGGPATAANIDASSILVDTSGNIYIADETRIRKIDATGIISTVAGDGTYAYNGDGIPATAAKLSYPYLGYTDDDGTLYFSDGFNHRLRKIDVTGTISTFAGGIGGSSGDGGPATAAGINNPGCLYRSKKGDIYIPDPFARRTRKIGTNDTITAFAGYGLGGSGGGDGGPATAAAVATVTNVVCDDSGKVYMCLSAANKIRVVDTFGIINTFAGTGTAGYSGDGGPATAAQFNSPAFIAAYNGDYYIADKYNNCIRRIGYSLPLSASVTDVAGSMAIYPNPAANDMVIAAAKPISAVSIVNMAGQVVATYKGTVPAVKQLSISIAHIPAGVYSVRVNNTYAGKFVKE